MSIYVLEGADSSASILYNIDSVDDSTLDKLIEIDSLPNFMDLEGFTRVLKASKELERVWYEYISLVPEIENGESTIDYKLESIKEQIDLNNMVTFEALAEMYETTETSNMTLFEVMAEMYEELMALKAKVNSGV